MLTLTPSAPIPSPRRRRRVRKPAIQLPKLLIEDAGAGNVKLTLSLHAFLKLAATCDMTFELVVPCPIPVPGVNEGGAV